jgi:hypothetical protein
MFSNLSMKQKIGWVIVALHLCGYLGVLLIGERALLVALPGFVLTFLVGLVNAPRRQSSGGVPGSPYAWAPFPIGAPLFAIAGSLLGMFFLLAYLSGGRGTSDVGDIGLLFPREHYTLSNHGLQSEVERWRFLAVGLLFYTLWTAGAICAACLVFIRSAPSIPRAGTPN